MSRTIHANLVTHLALATTTLAACWRIKRNDSVTTTYYGFTTASKDLSVDLGDGVGAILYKAAGGHLPTSISCGVGLSVDSMDGVLILDSTLGISRADVLAGRYDGGEVKVFLVNWNQTTIPTGEAIMLARGRVGRAQMRDLDVALELRSLSDAFNQEIGEVISPTCRAQLGDARCTVSLGTSTGTVQSVTTQREVFVITGVGDKAAGYFSYDKGRFITGANNLGTIMLHDVKLSERVSATQQRITLQRPTPYDIAVSDTFNLSAVGGCDKLFSTCKTKFSNQLNFQGEPHVPGITRVQRVPPER